MQWMGHSWTLHSYTGMPGPCTFAAANVFLEGGEYSPLHLRIAPDGTCAQLYTGPLGFGTYEWSVQTPLDHLDPNIVLGLFPHQRGRSVACQRSNEIDIEVAKWGSPAWQSRTQYTVFPHNADPGGDCRSLPRHVYVETVAPMLPRPTIHRLVWEHNRVSFRGQYADGEDFQPPLTWPDDGSAVWRATGGGAPGTYDPALTIPQSPMALIMNLWLFGGKSTFYSPAKYLDGFEVVLTAFRYTPLKRMAVEVTVGGEK